MFSAWVPAGASTSPYPFIDISINEGRATVYWKEYMDNKCILKIKITFLNTVGIYMIDESTYQTATTAKIPDTDILLSGSNKFSPAWKSSVNYRRSLYGELGMIWYEELYSYYIIGSDFVYIIDSFDMSPVCETIES